jgi:hypothetical protein
VTEADREEDLFSKSNIFSKGNHARRPALGQNDVRKKRSPRGSPRGLGVVLPLISQRKS